VGKGNLISAASHARRAAAERVGRCDDHHNILDIALRLLSFDVAAPESLMGRALRVAMEYDFSIHIHSIGVASDCR
jgi:hypothetical protein